MNKWDKRFMDLATLISSWSKDPKHKVGAVIVNRENHVLGFGYNGVPHGLKDTRVSDRVKALRTVHAELNAIFNSSGDLTGSSIYVYPFSPCAQCAAAIIQKKIARVVFYKQVKLQAWEESQLEASQMLTEAQIICKDYRSE